MNLFADESVDRPVVQRLRQDSHHVVYVAELALSIADDEVLGEANRHEAVLVTADKDVGNSSFGRVPSTPEWFCYASPDWRTRRKARSSPRSAGSVRRN